jgi:hypothetical protein
MNKIKVEKCYDGRGIEVKGGELNFEMEYDLKKVLGLVVESEIEEFEKSDMNYIEYYNEYNCVICNNVDDIVNDIVKCYEESREYMSEFVGEFWLSEDGFCRIYKDGELVNG